MGKNENVVPVNKNYPIEAYNCTITDFIRTFDTPIDSLPIIYNTISIVLLNQVILVDMYLFI